MPSRPYSTLHACFFARLHCNACVLHAAPASYTAFTYLAYVSITTSQHNPPIDHVFLSASLLPLSSRPRFRFPPKTGLRSYVPRQTLRAHLITLRTPPSPAACPPSPALLPHLAPLPSSSPRCHAPFFCCTFYLHARTTPLLPGPSNATPSSSSPHPALCLACIGSWSADQWPTPPYQRSNQAFHFSPPITSQPAVTATRHHLYFHNLLRSSPLPLLPSHPSFFISSHSKPRITKFSFNPDPDWESHSLFFMLWRSSDRSN